MILDKASMRLSFFKNTSATRDTLVLEKPESALSGLLTFVVFQKLCPPQDPRR